MDLEVGICLVSWKLSSGVEYNLRRRSRSLSSREKSRGCLEVMLMLVSCLLQGLTPQLISEFLHRTNETVILHIQADMLGYHGVSTVYSQSVSKGKLMISPASPCNLVYQNRKSPPPLTSASRLADVQDRYPRSSLPSRKPIPHLLPRTGSRPNISLLLRPPIIPFIRIPRNSGIRAKWMDP
jgi:hypothetical protein